MKLKNINNLEKIAKTIRQDSFQMLQRKGGGHFGGAFSCAEILSVLYGHIIKDDDRFILSKAHAGVALYSVLSQCGNLERSVLETYGEDDSTLGIHGESHFVPGVELSCGSLGHGLSFACGLALGKKKKKEPGNIYVLLGDGECQEGSVWEAGLFASQHKLSNLIAIIDCNKKQSSGLVKNILDIEPLLMKWESFGWDTVKVNGHSINGLITAINKAEKSEVNPTMIIANTIKGKSVDFLEEKEDCHYDRLNDEQSAIAWKAIK